MRYNHTQIGYLIIFTLLAVITLFINILLKDGCQTYLVMTMLLVLFILSSFLSLNVKINEDYLKIKFGWGIYKKQFFIKEITSVKIVKTNWYCGWGIRICFWPKKLKLYNVSGFDAVEITMNNGNIYQIGSDDIENLEKIITLSL